MKNYFCIKKKVIFEKKNQNKFLVFSFLLYQLYYYSLRTRTI